MKKKLVPPPIVDLGGKLQIISDEEIPRWRTVAHVFPASTTKAKEVMIEMELDSAWLNDGFERRLITL